jgi:malate permease and related proteins
MYGMRKPIDNFGTAFCNAGFIGIPLVTAVFGNEAAFYVASFASILNLLQWTYGIVIITRRKDMINIKKVFVNPVTISLVIGLFLFITGIKLPEVINSTMAGVAALNTPAAMIVLGYYLSCVRIRDLLLNPSLYLASFVRLIIIPMLTLLVLYIIPAGHGQIGMITLIATATPVGTSTAIFAQKFGQDYERAVCMVCLSTLFSIITMPVVMYLAQMWIM